MAADVIETPAEPDLGPVLATPDPEHPTDTFLFGVDFTVFGFHDASHVCVGFDPSGARRLAKGLLAFTETVDGDTTALLDPWGDGCPRFVAELGNDPQLQFLSGGFTVAVEVSTEQLETAAHRLANWGMAHG